MNTPKNADYTNVVAIKDENQLNDKMLIRLTAEEKQAFERAASVCGFVSLSGWVRNRLRRDCTTDLVNAGEERPFVKDNAKKKGSNRT